MNCFMASETKSESKTYVFSSLVEATQFHNDIEVQQNVKFNIRQCTSNFGKTELDENHKYRLNFYKTCPYIILGYKELECHHGPRWRKSKTVEKSSQCHTYSSSGKRKSIRPTKKLGCKATVTFREVLVFPAESIDPESLSASRRRSLAQKIRGNLRSGDAKIMVYYPDKDHTCHPVGEESRPLADLSLKHRAYPSPLQTLTVRLRPGEEIFSCLQEIVKEHHLTAAFVITCVGSVSQATLRMADSVTIKTYIGNMEIVSLVGTLSAGAHLHGSFSDSEGKVIGGHVVGDLFVYTTAEIVIGNNTNLIFTREMDSQSGYNELAVSNAHMESLPLLKRK